MNDVSEGIVLSSMDYREKDTLISVLTREFGRLSFVAKGTMSINSKNAPACLPYTSSEFCFDYREGKTVFPLKTAKIKNSRRQVREDLDLPEDCLIIPFSAEKGNGRDELVRQVLAAVKE